MQTYRYEVLREPGEPVLGTLDAEDPQGAVRSLLARGYHVLRVEPADARDRFRVPAARLWGTARRKGLLRFTRGLSALLRAGMPLCTALGRLRDQTDHKGWRAVIGGLKARLEDGSGFSEALAAYPEVFNPLYVSLVRVGEAGGNLSGALTRLVVVGERLADLRSRVLMALVYPAAMLALGVVTVSVLVTFVVPTFAEAFRESGQALPLPTATMLALSAFAGRYGVYALALLLILTAAGARWARSPAGKWTVARLSLSLPLIRRLVGKAQIAAFTRTLGNLLESGIDAVHALDTTAGTLQNAVYARAVRTMAEAVRGGESFHAAAEAAELLPPLVTGAIALGEESGQLAEALAQVADESEGELDREIKVFMTLLEPLMIVLMGGLVGFIVMAMLLPIFALGDTLPM